MFRVPQGESVNSETEKGLLYAESHTIESNLGTW